MCQAYEGERAYIVASERRAEIHGFTAAHDGKAEGDNPHGEWDSYRKEAWAHGWRCYHEGLLPLGVEQRVREGEMPWAKEVVRATERPGR